MRQESKKSQPSRDIVREDQAPPDHRLRDGAPRRGGDPGAMATMSDPLEAAIFDMDGVVTRTERLHQAAWKQLFDGFLAARPARPGEDHRPFSEADYQRHVDGKPRYDGIRAFLGSRGIVLSESAPGAAGAGETVRGLGLKKNDLFRDLVAREGVELDEAAVELVRAFREAGVRVGIATSSENGAMILERAGLGSLFDARVDGIISADLGLAGKPRPDLFLECARRLGVSAERALVVEDAASGVAAAREGGFGLVIGVDRGDNGLRLREAGSDWIVHTMDELSEELVARYWAERSKARPNILAEWRSVKQRVQGRRLAIFLDYDGTLTPIVDRPELAVLDAPMRKTLIELARVWPTHIVSGRGLDDIRGLVGIDTLWYAASHGYDIAAPEGTAGSRKVVPDLEPEVRRAASELQKATAHLNGVLVEDKRFSIAVHYRLAAQARVPELEAIVDEVVSRHRGLKKAGGKKVFELRPAMDWDKGKALLWLLESARLEGALPLYIGDDVTDEDAFIAIAERGLGILVTDFPRFTHASHSLQDPSEVRVFLERLVTCAEEADA